MRVTWFGHSAFLLEAGDAKVLIDPYLTGNPTFESIGAKEAEAARESAARGLTHIVVTHGHGDHIGDAASLARASGAVTFCNYEVGAWLEKAAGRESALRFELMNTGGTVENGGVRVTLTRADHSSAMIENGEVRALGASNGAIVRLPGAATLWHMGDTDIFSDMALIDQLHAPEIVILPIGDRFTMGPEAAAHAVRHFLPSAKLVIPAHYGTFGLLTGTPDAFRKALGDKARLVVEFRPHETREL